MSETPNAATIPEYKFHRLCRMFPTVDGEEFKELCDDIESNGLKHPIMLFKDKEAGETVIIDGRNRYRACKKKKIVPAFKHLQLKKGESLVNWVISANLQRRHLTPSQRATVAAKLMPLLEKEAEARRAEGHKQRGKAGDSDDSEKGTSRDKASKVAGASPRATQDAKTLQKEDPALFQKVEEGEVSLNAANRMLKEKKQKAAKEKASKDAPKVTESGVCTFRHGDVMMELESLAKTKNRYDLIVADPPKNDGVDYGQGIKKNKRPHDEYVSWCREWIKKCYDVLSKSGAMWLVCSEDYLCHIMNFATASGFNVKLITWQTDDPEECDDYFNNCSKYILHCCKTKSPYFDAEVFMRERGPEGEEFNLCNDVWFTTDIPLLEERIEGFPKQLPLEVLHPMIDGTTKPGDSVLNLFSGSGSVAHAALTCKSGPRKCVLVENNAEFISISKKRIDRVVGRQEDADKIQKGKKKKKKTRRQSAGV